MNVHRSDSEGVESIITFDQFRDEAREHATPQPLGDGGVKVIEGITALSFDDDQVVTFIVGGVSYTMPHGGR